MQLITINIRNTYKTIKILFFAFFTKFKDVKNMLGIKKYCTIKILYKKQDFKIFNRYILITDVYNQI